MLLEPDGIIAMLREQREHDLAIVAIVAGMARSEAEAVERLGEIEQAMRDWRKTLSRGDFRQRQIVERVLAITPRLASAIGQVEERAAA